MIKTASEVLFVTRLDADIDCDGLGAARCPASVGYTIDDADETPRRLAAEDGWWSDGVVDLCPACQRNPRRHAYVEPRSGPRWDNGCRLCNHLPESHEATS